jgi:hypothetical protein
MIIDHGNTTIPLWELLSYGNQVALIMYQNKYYAGHRLKIVNPAPDISPFDADKEMRQKPNYEREAMK